MRVREVFDRLRHSITPLVVVFMAGGLLSNTTYGQSEPITFELGPEETVYDWTTDRCENADIPDGYIRSLRDRVGDVYQTITHWNNRKLIGSNFNSLIHDCDITLASEYDPDFTKFNEREYISNFYTEDGITVYATIHNEHHGDFFVTDEDDSSCPGFENGGFVRADCLYWNNTFAISEDMGRTFTHLEAPTHHMASLPDPYEPGLGPVGIALGDIHKKDGYYYRVGSVPDHGVQQEGTIIARTDDVSDPKSWRCWDGDSTDDEVDGFTIRFIDPYTEPQPFDPADHVCEPISPWNGDFLGPITYNTYLQKYILTTTKWLVLDENGEPIYGFYYSLSEDLMHWSRLSVLWETPTTKAPFNPDMPRRSTYPALVDPSDTSFNFDQTDNQVYLYYTVLHQKGLDRDLIRREVTIIDDTAPTIEISAPNKDLVNNTVSVKYTVTYSDAAKMNVNLTKDHVLLNHSGNIDVPGVVKTVTNHDNNTSTVTLSNIDGNGTLGISIDEGAISDAPGNVTGLVGPSQTFEVDNTAPTIEISGPNIAATKNGPVSYTVTYTGADDVELDPEDVHPIPSEGVDITGLVKTVTGGDTATPTVTLSNFSGNGELRMRVFAGTAKDNAGNYAPGSAWSAPVIVDNTPPLIEFSPPSVPVTNDGPVEYIVTYVGADEVSLSLDKINFVKTGAILPIGEITGLESQNEGDTIWKVTVGNISGDGTLAVRILYDSARDAAGNIALRTISTPFTVDNMPPVVEISEPSVSQTALGPVTYDVTYTGAVAETIDLMGKVTLNKTSEGEEVFGEVSVSETGNPRIVTIDNISGIGKLGITINEGTASDAAGNPAPLAGPSMTFEVDDTDTDGDGDPDLDDEDDDNDGIDDTYEEAHSECLNPLQADDPDVDGDGDRLTLLEEFTINTNPCEADTDGDKIDDMLDGDPLIGDNVCSGSDEAVYIEKVEENEEVQCGAAISIEVSPDVDELGLLRLISPKVILNSGGVSGELLIDSSHPCQACGL